MLKEGAIEQTHRNDLVLSSIYTVPKKNGKPRAVINLRWINQHLHRKHFKMSTMKDVKAAMTQGCWMAKLDLKDCFWALPVADRDQRFLAFEYEGKKYLFKVLPFGLGPSPMFITKLYRKVVEHLQSRGHRVIIFIDDLLLLGNTKAECARTLQAALDLLHELGAVVNSEKSSCEPSQLVTYLGFELDSVAMVITAPANKMANLHKALKKAARAITLSARDAASLLGKLGSMADAMLPVRVHTSSLHNFQLKALKQGWDTPLPLNLYALQDIRWWIKNLHSLNGRAILQPLADFKAATDASDYGWGAWIRTPRDLISWGGLFSKAEAWGWHINKKELLALLYFLQSCSIDLRNKVVDLGVDNTTALAYVRKLGGRKHYLSQISDQEFHVMTTLKTRLLAYHLPGEINTLADHESRKMRALHSTDLQLNPAVFARIEANFGPHTIDAFSTRQNRQLRRFGAWEPQPEATWTDSLSKSWLGENVWANPPFSLIGRILQKVQSEGSTLTLLAPLWTGQPWFPRLMSMSVAPPLLLPHLPHQALFHHPLMEQYV